MIKAFAKTLLMLLFWQTAQAQVAQDCIDAVPICSNTPINGGTNGFGTDDFNGAASSGCLEQTTTGVIESNSAWYRFRTAESGQLGFNIGHNSNEDWDFALYKSADCNNLGEPVRCNFFDNTEENSFLGVGEDPTGNTDNFQYEDWLEVVPGEEYYLLINNFSNTNSGYSVQFSGNIFITDPYTALDCSIINNLLGPPISACVGDSVVLDATTIDAIQYKWFSDTGTGPIEVIGETNPTLNVTTSANYEVEVITVTNNNINSSVQVIFSEVPTAFPISDDASCSGLDTFDLSQKDAEVLGAQDPAEYVVGYYLSLDDANSGANVLPKNHETQAGSQTIFVRVSALNNPNCFDVSERFDLINLETPVLDFPSEAYLCEDGGSTFIGDPDPHSNYTYSWDSGQTGSGFDIAIPGTYTVTVTDDEGCSAVTEVIIMQPMPMACHTQLWVTPMVAATPILKPVAMSAMATLKLLDVSTSTMSILRALAFIKKLWCH